MSTKRTKRRMRGRQGFTLIEILTVIAIIGILVGLLIPAIGAARRYVANSAVMFEIQTIGNAVQQYKNKFEDFPPDGSSRAVFERHFRKAFPNMAPSEFAILYSVANNHSGTAAGLAPADTVMDAAEALVFCLGGFSDDPTRPFTGPGGPLSLVPGTTDVYQYNVNRNKPMYEFKQEQLSLFVDVNANRTISVDEETLSGLTTADNDLLPVYNPGRNLLAPIVYFDSRTYSFAYGSNVFFNYYRAPNLSGTARPYKSDNINTNVPGPAASSDILIRDAYVRYVNDKSFQLISAGLDDDYGGLPQQGTTPVFYKFPSGDAVDIMNPTGSGFSRYTEVSGVPSAQLDNVANFADGILEDAMDN